MYMETQLATTQGWLDKQHLVSLYEQHSPALFRYAYRLLGERSAAEDCVAETFSRFLRAVHNGRKPSENTQAYLYRMAHNWVVDFYRRKPNEGDLMEAEQRNDPEDDPTGLAIAKQKREAVRAALRKLPREQQQVIALRFLEEWSHERVAETLGKSVEATRALQHRALTSLKKLLVELEDEGNVD